MVDLLAGGAVGDAGEVWLAVGTALFGLGALSFAGRAVGSRDRRRSTLSILAALVSAGTLVSYLALLSGVGVVEVTGPGGSTTLQWARYAEWLVTMPLLVVGIGVAAGVEREQLASAAAVTVFMIATGLAAMLSGMAVYRAVWIGVAAVALLAVAAFLTGGLVTGTPRDRTPAATASTGRLGGGLAVLLLAYPCWWLVASGAGVVPPSVGIAGFVLLDLVTKRGVGVLVVRTETTASGAEPTAHVPQVAGDGTSAEPPAAEPAE